mgnify:CR=1 FL=1
MEQNKYVAIWLKYLPVVLINLKKASTVEQEIILSEHEFTAVGARHNAGYSITIKMEKGKVINDLSGSAVARDFVKVLQQNEEIARILKQGSYKFSMGKGFILRIMAI